MRRHERPSCARVQRRLPQDGSRDVYDALDSLRRERLASIEFRDPEVPEAEQEWSLTRKGATAAAQIVGFAGRVIGWPPAPPSALG